MTEQIVYADTDLTALTNIPVQVTRWDPMCGGEDTLSVLTGWFATLRHTPNGAYGRFVASPCPLWPNGYATELHVPYGSAINPAHT
jgi:hypothetical protein